MKYLSVVLGAYFGMAQIIPSPYPNSIALFNTIQQKGVELTVKDKNTTSPEFFTPKMGASIGLKLNYKYLTLQLSQATQNYNVATLNLPKTKRFSIGFGIVKDQFELTSNSTNYSKIASLINVEDSIIYFAKPDAKYWVWHTQYQKFFSPRRYSNQAAQFQNKIQTTSGGSLFLGSNLLIHQLKDHQQSNLLSLDPLTSNLNQLRSITLTPTIGYAYLLSTSGGDFFVSPKLQIGPALGMYHYEYKGETVTKFKLDKLITFSLNAGYYWKQFLFGATVTTYDYQPKYEHLKAKYVDANVTVFVAFRFKDVYSPMDQFLERMDSKKNEYMDQISKEIIK